MIVARCLCAFLAVLLTCTQSSAKGGSLHSEVTTRSNSSFNRQGSPGLLGMRLTVLSAMASNKEESHGMV
jgi:hypothetical protein